jgi:sialate O-acetylesterase
MFQTLHLKILKKGIEQFLLCTIIAGVLLPSLVKAQLSIPGVFGNNAVFQQKIKIPVWGKATPGASVIVSFAKHTKQINADENGKWIVYLPAMKANSKTYQLIVKSGTEKVIFDNIVLGEVWLTSGQSNMSYNMNSDLVNKEEEIKNANYSNIRFRNIDNTTSIVPLDMLRQQDWKICTPENVGSCSAVAYFFARALYIDQKIPVGIINASRGSTGIESWMSKDKLIAHPDFTKDLSTRNEDSAHWTTIVNNAIKANAYRENIANTSFVGLKVGVPQLNYDDSNWKKTAYPLSAEKMGYANYWGMLWVRKTFDISSSQLNQNWTISLPIKDQNDIVYLNGKELKRDVSKLKNKSVFIPAAFLQSGKNVLTIRMYINWGIADIGDRLTNCFLKSEQGEQIELSGLWAHNNAIEPEVAGWQNFYTTSTVNYNAMIHPIIPYAIKGFLWYQGENNSRKPKQYTELQPMLIDDWRTSWKEGSIPFLYVQLPNYKSRSATPTEDDYLSIFREAQKTTLIRSTNTGMACTIDIGDEFNIHPGNKQDVGKRLYLIAQDKVYHQKVVSEGPVFKSAKIEGNTIRLSFYNVKYGLKSNSDSLNNCFAVADQSGKWFWANAKIERNEIFIKCGEVQHPMKLQYAWQNNPVAPLYSHEGLPMIPFNEILNQ